MIERVKKTAYRHLVIPVVAVLCLLWSCSSDRGTVLPGEGDADTESYVMGIAATIATRAGEESSGDAGAAGNDNKSFDINQLIPYTLAFDEGSVLQVSQQATNLPPFQTEDAIFNYRYISTYEDHEGAWDDENSYNFTPHGQDVPLEWNRIANVGSFNGGFAMYCLYFPGYNQIRSTTNQYGAINYTVLEDQSTVENLKQSDILGAYHSTPAIFSRIRFRLFHLMTYIRIRLYVPVYNDAKNTGYREDALKYATLDNVTNEFAIDWNISRSSDEQGPVVSPLSGDGSIKMYLHPLKDGQTQHEIEQIKYKDYLPDDYYNQGIDGDYDDVRVYDFSVIIPKQKGIIGDDNKESNFTDTKFLNFYLQTNAGGTTRYYFTQKQSANTNDSTLEINQGVFQYIQLYVPRVGNQVVFVGATVSPWNQMKTGMFFDDPTDWTDE